MFWLGLFGVIGVEVAYQFTDYSYYWFANAQQAQSALLALMLFVNTTYKDTAIKAVSLVCFAWFCANAITDSLNVFGFNMIGSFCLSLFAVCTCWVAYVKIKRIQGL